MKKIFILPLLFLMACSSAEETEEEVTTTTEAPSPQETAAPKKYDIKSGIITFISTMESGDMKLQAKKILYFNHYGNIESEEEYKTVNGKDILIARNIEKGGYRYTLNIENGNGARTRGGGFGVVARYDKEEAQKTHKEAISELPDESIAGKNCTGYALKNASGIIKMFGWNHITLKTIMENPNGGKVSMIAIKVEENVSVPAEKFEVPPTVVMTEM